MKHTSSLKITLVLKAHRLLTLWLFWARTKWIKQFSISFHLQMHSLKMTKCWLKPTCEENGNEKKDYSGIFTPSVGKNYLRRSMLVNVF